MSENLIGRKLPRSNKLDELEFLREGVYHTECLYMMFYPLRPLSLYFCPLYLNNVNKKQKIIYTSLSHRKIY